MILLVGVVVAGVILGAGVDAAVPFPPLVLRVFMVRGAPVVVGSMLWFQLSSSVLWLLVLFCVPASVM
ncbi:hypothetical protein DPMN_088789 [Dreissena polymorpha]|uniref:Uncharacterized protein n=1 Tax=Dreissena polymorpha TaxID=45954 RepID=A0A9D4KUR3_DREPO|nr:hypothetical protein DPMN_088789 [Dreissena polymorpha]